MSIAHNWSNGGYSGKLKVRIGHETVGQNDHFSHDGIKGLTWETATRADRVRTTPRSERGESWGWPVVTCALSQPQDTLLDQPHSSLDPPAGRADRVPAVGVPSSRAGRPGSSASPKRRRSGSPGNFAGSPRRRRSGGPRHRARACRPRAARGRPAGAPGPAWPPARR